MDDVTLLRCPLCGDADDFNPSMSPSYKYRYPGTGNTETIRAGSYVECGKCGCCGPVRATDDLASEAWNTRADLAERDKESERDIAAEAEFLCARLRGLESELADDATAAEYYGHVVPSVARLEGLLKCAALQTNGER
jgi:hypothetical protein